MLLVKKSKEVITVKIVGYARISVDLEEDKGDKVESKIFLVFSLST